MEEGKDMLSQTKKIKSKKISRKGKNLPKSKNRISLKNIAPKQPITDYSIIEGCIRQTMYLPIENSG